MVTYTYDNADRLLSITQGSNVVTFTYDTAGRRAALTLPSTVSTEYAYDAASRLTGLTYKHGMNTLGALTYTYDSNGQRRRVGGTWAQTGLPQPVASATYNAANQQLTFGGQTLTYDLNGNLTGDGVYTYTWNARDQLAGLSGPNAASFAYDALGRRRQRTVNGGITTFLYDGLNPVKESTDGGVTNLLAGLSLDEFFLRSDAGGAQGLLADGLGSTIAITDGAGAVATEYTYEPFGTTTSIGAATLNKLQFTGRENDGIGLYHYRARYYHPGLSRFISEDPIGRPEFSACPRERALAGRHSFATPETANLYAYVSNRPTVLRDPSGLGPCEDVLFGCLSRAGEESRKCLKNVLDAVTACGAGCVPLCAVFGPAAPQCIATCLGGCATGGGAMTTACGAVYMTERGICGYEYANCRREEQPIAMPPFLPAPPSGQGAPSLAGPGLAGRGK